MIIMQSELKEAISRLLHHNRAEERDWEQSARYGQGPGFVLSGYDPSLSPGHIYHTIQKLRQFVDEPGE